MRVCVGIYVSAHTASSRIAWGSSLSRSLALHMLMIRSTQEFRQKNYYFAAAPPSDAVGEFHAKLTLLHVLHVQKIYC
jgi:hypothetical protein